MIASKRVLLRRLNLGDFANMRKLEADADIMKFTPSRYPLREEKSREKLSAIIEKEQEYEPLGVWAAELKESGAFVGWFMLLATDLKHPELGFMMVKEFWGKGMATEIGSTILSYAASLGHTNIMARTDTENFASQRVLEKLGFSFLESKKTLDKVLQREIETKYFLWQQKL